MPDMRVLIIEDNNRDLEETKRLLLPILRGRVILQCIKTSADLQVVLGDIRANTGLLLYDVIISDVFFPADDSKNAAADGESGAIAVYRALQQRLVNELPIKDNLRFIATSSREDGNAIVNLIEQDNLGNRACFFNKPDFHGMHEDRTRRVAICFEAWRDLMRAIIGGGENQGVIGSFFQGQLQGFSAQPMQEAFGSMALWLLDDAKRARFVGELGTGRRWYIKELALVLSGSEHVLVDCQGSDLKELEKMLCGEANGEPGLLRVVQYNNKVIVLENFQAAMGGNFTANFRRMLLNEPFQRYAAQPAARGIEFNGWLVILETRGVEDEPIIDDALADMIAIRLPAIRERTLDLPALTKLFLADQQREFDDGAIAWLAMQDWPRNLASLKKFITQFANDATYHGAITSDALDRFLRSHPDSML